MKVVFREIACQNISGEIPDVIGFKGTHSIVIECKRSRADFLNDKKKRFRQYKRLAMGTFKFYLCPAGLIKKEELPEDWGLIYVYENSKTRTIVTFKNYHILKNKCNASQVELLKEIVPERNIDCEYNFMYSVLRRLEGHGVLNKVYEKY